MKRRTDGPLVGSSVQRALMNCCMREGRITRIGGSRVPGLSGSMIYSR